MTPFHDLSCQFAKYLAHASKTVPSTHSLTGTKAETADEQVPGPRLHRLCGLLGHGRTLGRQRQHQWQQHNSTEAEAAEGHLEGRVLKPKLEVDDAKLELRLDKT